MIRGDENRGGTNVAGDDDQAWVIQFCGLALVRVGSKQTAFVSNSASNRSLMLTETLIIHYKANVIIIQNQKVPHRPVANWIASPWQPGSCVFASLRNVIIKLNKTYVIVIFVYVSCPEVCIWKETQSDFREHFSRSRFWEGNYRCCFNFNWLQLLSYDLNFVITILVNTSLLYEYRSIKIFTWLDCSLGGILSSLVHRRDGGANSSSWTGEWFVHWESAAGIVNLSPLHSFRHYYYLYS